jgi:hypothetical protein
MDWKLSPRETECLLLLIKRQIEGGGMPTYTELGRQMGGISGIQARRYLEQLQYKGALPKSAAYRASIAEVERCFQQMLIYIGWNGSIDGTHPIIKKAEAALDHHLETRMCDPRTFLSADEAA